MLLILYHRFLACCFLACCFLAWGANDDEVKVRAFVQPKGVLSLEDTLNLTVEIEYTSVSHIGNPRLPALSGFHLLGESQAQKIFMGMGTMVRKKQYHYVLQPEKEGQFQIGSIEVVVDGKAYKTKALQVEVSSQVQRRQRPTSPFGGLGGGQGMDPFSIDPFSLVRPSVQDKPIRKGDILVKAEVPKTTVYVGELLLAQWFLYFLESHNMDISSEISSSPELNGFWVESVSRIASKTQREDINGRSYIKRRLISSALFPVQTGELTIGALSVKSRVMGGLRSFFSSASPFNVMVNQSPKKNITVLPLPKKGRGPGWTEAVGDFVISAHLNKMAGQVGTPLVYKVVFKGKGHPRLINMPKLDFGAGWQVYDVTESQTFSLKESQKNYEIIIIPQQVGELMTPAFELTSFDPELGVYKTHILPQQKLTITKKPGGLEKESEKPNPLRASKKDVPEPSLSAGALASEGADVSAGAEGLNKEHLKNISAMVRQPHWFLQNRKMFWFVLWAGLFLFFTVVFYTPFRKRPYPFLKQEIKMHLKQADRAIKAKDWKGAGLLLNQLLYHFLAELSLGTAGAVKNWDSVLQNLPPSVRIQHKEQIQGLIHKLEKLCFAPEQEAKHLRNKQQVIQIRRSLLTLLRQLK